ncbi:MAG: S8 family serine peptidase [bacterium]|nr:S8 family serine peptidase [bacterium]
MSRTRLSLVLLCLLVPSLIPAAGPNAEPPSKLSPAMNRLFEAEAGPYRVWIFFVDKGLPDGRARDEALARVAESHSPRAVERRRLRGRHAVDGGPLFDVRDLPLHESYVEQVIDTGARVRIRSRWVNAVSAEATRPQIDAIAALSAVVKVQPVARSRRPELVEAQAEQSAQPTAGSPALDYGRSTAQLTQINLIALHEAGYTGEGVIVGILDTGFRRDHAAFNQPGHEVDVVAEYDFVDDDPDTSNQPGDPSSQHDHGTKILGTLGSYFPGELVGGAFGASFALAKTEDTTGEYQAEEDNYVAGLEFLEAQGVDMTTSSLGYIDWYTQADLDGETAVTTIAINAASDAGVHSVTAAGNEYHDTNPATSSIIAPADAHFVITGGAVTSSGSISSFSSDGPSADGRVKPELLAQGSSTATISSTSTTAFTTANGTSLSTPLVAGAVACLIQANPNWTVQRMREELFTNADYDPGGLGFDPEYVRGYGIVDALATHVNAYAPAGFVLLEDEAYSCDDTLAITVRDDNIPGDPPTITIELSSTTEVVPELVTLTQVAPGEGRYAATFPTTPNPPLNGDGALSVNHGGVLTVEYTDADDGAGGTDVNVTDNADLDCAPPVITGVQSYDVTGRSAQVGWLTGEPADSTVHYGTSPPGTEMSVDTELVESHAVRLTGLDECSAHYFWVASADAVGNTASANNGGAYYSFETGRNVNPSYDSSDTPRAIDDNTTVDSVISVTDDKTVLDAIVHVDITHTYDGDLRLSLISPTGTAITLSDRRGSSGNDFAGTVFDDDATTPISSGSAPFSGSFIPDTPLSDVDGIDAAGDWTLRVEDLAGGDQGTLNDWTLTLLYPAQACGPHARSTEHLVEDDVCTTGGIGAGNGQWDAGEEIRFALELENDGTDPLSGVWAEIVPLNPGVVMLKGDAAYPDIPESGSAHPLPPAFAAQIPDGFGCGDTIEFAVAIHADQGSWTGGFAQEIGRTIPGVGTALFEDFEGGLPAGWTMVDGLADGNTWYIDNTSDPGGCSNTDPNPPLAGNWMTVDSDCTGSGVAMDEELISTPIDVSAALSVSLEFDHYYNHLGPETADVDVRSSSTGGEWINVGKWTADSPNPEHVSLDITSAAAGAGDLQLRWHYYDADFEWFWHIDNVEVVTTSAASCDMPVCAAAAGSPPPIPDGSLSTLPVLADRLDVAGTALLIRWDPQCSPQSTKLLYGSLGNVSSHGFDGATCGIAQPHVWDPAPTGDLWFLLIADDGLGAESSWGSATSGERNGTTASGTCGSTLKNLSGACP